MEFTVDPGAYCIAKLPASATPPADFLSIVRDGDELTLVVREPCEEPVVAIEGGWKALRMAGPIPFEQTGVLASFIRPLADARISVFAISTYSTDLVLIRSADLDRAVQALESAGNRIPTLQHGPPT